MSVTYPQITHQVGGNTAGATANISSGTYLLAGGNNITLSQNANSITISGAAGGGGNTGSISAGTTKGTLGEVVFSNSNGISFGIDGQTVTASHNALTSQSNQALSGSNGSFAFQTATFGNLNGASFYTSNGSMVVSYTVPSTAGLLSNINVSAGTTSNNLSALTFSDSNGVSFGLNGSVVTATVQTNYLTSQSNQAVSAANGSYAFQTLSFSNANGVSFGTSAGSAITASYTVPTVTNSSWTVSDNGTSGSVARLAFTNLNGVTLSLSTGAGGSHTIVGSHNAITSQTNQSGGIYAVGNTTGQSSSSTYDARTLSVDGGGIVSVGWSNSTLRVSATQSNQAFSAAGGSSAFQTLSFGDNVGVSFTNSNGSLAVASVKLSMYAASNTTQSSSGTANHSALTFAGAGIASVGVTGGSVVVSVPSGGGAGDGVNILAAGTQTANTTGTVLFADSNGITFGMSDSSKITASHNGLTAGIQSISAGTTRITSGQVVWSNSNGLSFGANGQTMTAGMNRMSYFEPLPPAHNQAVVASTLALQKVFIPRDITATEFNIMVGHTNSSSAGNTVTWSIGIYTISGSTASRVSSSSGNYSYNSTAAASSYTHYSGTRIYSIPTGSWNITNGEYLIAVLANSSTSGTAGTWSYLLNRSNYTLQGLPGGANNYTRFFGNGVYSVATTQLPATIHLTDIVQSSNQALRQPWFAIAGTF